MTRRTAPTAAMQPWGRILVLPLATAAVIAASAWIAGPEGGGDAGYLALLAALVLVPATYLAADAKGAALLAPVLLGAAAWMAPPPTRGAAVGLLLVVIVAGSVLHAARRGSWTFDRLCAGALALQLLAASKTLLGSRIGAQALLDWILLPLVAAVATGTLIRTQGPTRGLIAAAAVATVAGGFTVGATLSLGAVAAVSAVGRLRRRAIAPALVLSALLPLFVEPRPWTAVGEESAWLLVLLPLLPLAPRGRRALAMAAAAAAVLGLRLLPLPDALPLSLALAACALPDGREAGRVLTLWSGGLLALATLLGTYPWLRREALTRLAGALPASWLLWVVAAAAVLFVALLERGGGQRKLALAAGTAVAVLWLVLRPSTEVVQQWPTITLTASESSWTAPPLAAATDRLVIDSAVANGAELAAGTVVATVELEGERGRLGSWPLRIGEETAEWAAGRADLRHLPRPTPWVSVVDPSGTFFAYRYRSALPLATAATAVRLSVERAASLPPETTLTLYLVALRRAKGGPYRR